ncbi:MAG: hypothetical protein N2449_08540 [Bacteroidales bacterium]|nr:hypothetical protein [Bacteroidales bacterium]
MKKVLFLHFITIYCIIQAQTQDSVFVKIYMRCTFCNQDYIRNEIKFINYVRDVSDANVVVLGVSESTGSGGEKYRFIFEGKKEFSGINDTIVFETAIDASEEEIREQYIVHLKLGVLPYLLKTPIRNKITYEIPEQQNNNTLIIDKWKGWLFSINSSGWFNGEQSNKSYNINSSIQVSKIKEEWKFLFHLNQSYSNNKFKYEDYEYEYINESNSASLTQVWSLSSHWSAGVFLKAGSSTYNNYKFYTHFMPAIEYNIFPYSMSFQKQFRFDYRIGIGQFMYYDTTIFNKVNELNGMHELNISFEIFKTWGSIDMNINGTQYLHDFSLFSLGSFLGMSVRIVKGLSFYFYGGYNMIRNQINLAKQDISQEELLLRQRQMKTNYSYWGNIGLNYSFGTKYNNVVNPRFD